MFRVWVCACIALVLSFGVLDRCALGDVMLTVPGPNGTAEGNSNNYFPFSIGGYFPAMRYQQAYSTSAFAAMGGPAYITQIAFRPDTINGQAFSVTLSDVQINLSTTSKSITSLSTVFAQNVGADDTVVYDGSLTLSSAFTGPASGPKNFDVIINLTTPFLYDRTKGDLLLDVRNSSPVYGALLDAVSDTSATGVNRLWSSSLTSLRSINDPGPYPAGGLVTRFTFSNSIEHDAPIAPLPNAAWGALGLMGVFAMWKMLRRRIWSHA